MSSLDDLTDEELQMRLDGLESHKAEIKRVLKSRIPRRENVGSIFVVHGRCSVIELRGELRDGVVEVYDPLGNHRDTYTRARWDASPKTILEALQHKYEIISLRGMRMQNHQLQDSNKLLNHLSKLIREEARR